MERTWRYLDFQVWPGFCLCVRLRKAFSATELCIHVNALINTFLVFLLFVFLHLNLNLDGNCGILGNCDS